MGIANKKGVFFIMLTIIVLSLFLVSITFFSTFASRKATQKRVETLNEFVFSIEEDLPRQLFTTGFRTVFLIERKITETGVCVTDVNQTLQEAFFQGEFEGQPEQLLEGARFSDLEERMKNLARKVSANITLSTPTISAEQEDPWNLKITLTTKFLVEDKSNLAAWNKTLVSSAYIPVEGFGDPMYTVKTNGLIYNEVAKGDISNLYTHLKNSHYIASATAPSFTDRLECSFTLSSPNGIESLVDLEDLATQGIPQHQKSVVDYIYFSSNNPSSCTVTEMPSWFRLDSSHLDIYQVSCSS